MTDGGYGSTVAPGALIIVYNDDSHFPVMASASTAWSWIPTAASGTTWRGEARLWRAPVLRQQRLHRQLQHPRRRVRADGRVHRPFSTTRRTTTINNNLLHDCLKMINDRSPWGQWRQWPRTGQWRPLHRLRKRVLQPARALGWATATTAVRTTRSALPTASFTTTSTTTGVGVWESGYERHPRHGAATGSTTKSSTGKMNYNGPARVGGVLPARRS